MRNPDRIDWFCAQFAEIWKAEQPDWRFGQLMLNFLGENNFDCDPWFLEEDAMINALQTYFDDKKGVNNDSV